MNKTNDEWQKAFIICFVKFRDYFFEQEATAIVGYRIASAINGLLNNYFLNRRSSVPIPEASGLSNNEDMALFINNVILSYIYDENSEILDLDWREMYILKEEKQL